MRDKGPSRACYPLPAKDRARIAALVIEVSKCAKGHNPEKHEHRNCTLRIASFSLAPLDPLLFYGRATIIINK